MHVTELKELRRRVEALVKSFLYDRDKGGFKLRETVSGGSRQHRLAAGATEELQRPENSQYYNVFRSESPSFNKEDLNRAAPAQIQDHDKMAVLLVAMFSESTPTTTSVAKAIKASNRKLIVAMAELPQD